MFDVIGRGTEWKWLCKFLCFYESFICPKVVLATSSSIYFLKSISGL